MNLKNGLVILVLGLLSATTLALDIDSAAKDTDDQKTAAGTELPPPPLPAEEPTAAPTTTAEMPAEAPAPIANETSDAAVPTDTSGTETTPIEPPVEASATTEFKTLDQDVQTLKKDVLDLNRELFVLEEELLYPADTQVAIFISMDVGTFFGLDTITLKVDNKQVANYLYTTRETQALLKGGVQRVYVGNLKVGEHELVAFFTGKGPNQRDYKRGATLKFTKGVGAKYLELKISDKVIKEQPEYVIKEWE